MSLPFFRLGCTLSGRLHLARASIGVHIDRECHSKGKFLLYSVTQKTSLIAHEPVRHFSVLTKFEEYIGKAADSDAVLTLQQKLIDFHDWSGLPWWAIIILTTVMIRTTVILPITIHQHYVIGKLEQIEKEVFSTMKNEVGAEIRERAEKSYWNDRIILREYKKELIRRKGELIREYNCHPLKTCILIVLQIPVWIAMSCAIRNLTYMHPVADVTAQIVYLEMKANSMLWISDLTIPDSSWCLPVMVGLFNLMNIEVMKMSRIRKESKFQVFCIFLSRIVAVGLVYWASLVPKTVVLYWATSALYAVVQNMVLLIPSVRKACRLPIFDNMRTHPLKYFINRIKAFVYLFRY